MDQRPSGGRRSAMLVAIAALALGAGGALAYAMVGGAKPEHTVAALPPEPPAPPAPPPLPEPPKPAGAEVAPAPVPADVVITVKGAPAEMDVLVGGKPIGKTPSVRLARGDKEVELTFAAKGYRSETRTVTPDADGELSVSLIKEAAAPATTPAGKPATAPATKPGGGGVNPELQFE